MSLFSFETVELIALVIGVLLLLEIASFIFLPRSIIGFKRVVIIAPSEDDWDMNAKLQEEDI